MKELPINRFPIKEIKGFFTNITEAEISNSSIFLSIIAGIAFLMLTLKIFNHFEHKNYLKNVLPARVESAEYRLAIAKSNGNLPEIDQIETELNILARIKYGDRL